MRKREENKFKMYQSVGDLLTANEVQLGALPKFNETLAEFKGKLTIIEELDKDKTGKTTGITEKKSGARHRLEVTTLDLIAILMAYATFNDEPQMLNDIDYSESQLERASEQTLIGLAGKVLEYANANQAEVAAYGLTRELIADSEAAYKELKERQSTVRPAIVDRKSSGEQMEARIDEADDLLKK